MKNNSKYTASEALQYIDGIHKKRFYEMMNSGEISYTLETWGNKTRRIIEASELIRVFGNKFILETKPKTVSETINKPPSPTETNSRNDNLSSEIVEFLKNQLEHERNERKLEREESLEREKYLRSQNEKLTDAINKQTLLLEDMRHKSNKPKEAEPRKKFLGIF